MPPHSLQTLISNDEDTCHPFMHDFSPIDGLAAEGVAFANTAGGKQITERRLKPLRALQAVKFRGAPKRGAIASGTRKTVDKTLTTASRL